MPAPRQAETAGKRRLGQQRRLPTHHAAHAAQRGGEARLGAFAHHAQTPVHQRQGNRRVLAPLVRLPVKRRRTQAAVLARGVQPFRYGTHAHSSLAAR